MATPKELAMYEFAKGMAQAGGFPIFPSLEDFLASKAALEAIPTLDVVYIDPNTSPQQAGSTATFRSSWLLKQLFYQCEWQNCPVSARLGMPLKIAPIAKMVPETKDLPNIAASILFREIDPSSGHFGYNAYGPIIGSVVVARCDHGELDGEIVGRVIDFVQEAYAPVYTRAYVVDDENAKEALRKEALENLTAEKFQKYMNPHVEQPHVAASSAQTSGGYAITLPLRTRDA